MTLTIEALKADEQSILSQINHLSGALKYNKQLQEYLQKEGENNPTPIEPCPSPSSTGS
jgi:hypothetical protein